MARRLPDDPVKRRHQVFKRIYQNMEHWQALREDRGMDSVITDELTGEDIYIGDLLVGLDSLPPRQRQAFGLICLRGYTETAARDELLPNSPSSTPVQQYADSALARMVRAYDLKQVGLWPPIEEPKAPPRKKKKTIRRKIMAVLHPLVRAGLEKTRDEACEQVNVIVSQIAELQAQLGDLNQAVAQVDELLGTSGGQPDAVELDQQPAPNPKPVGKPDLQQVAKELMDASL